MLPQEISGGHSRAHLARPGRAMFRWSHGGDATPHDACALDFVTRSASLDLIRRGV